MTSQWQRLSLRWRITLATTALAAALAGLVLAAFPLLEIKPTPAAIVTAALVFLGTLIIGCRLLTGHLLRTADQMARQARDLSWEGENTRLPVINPHDEFGRLADAFNNLLSRHEETMEQSRRFAADVSHELRTPLTAMRSAGEVALSQGNADAASLGDAIGAMLEESQRMTHLIDDLLMLSRSHESPPPEPEEIDLEAFLEEAADMVRVLAEEKKQTLVTASDAGAKAQADGALLRLALLNLLTNAVRHSPPGVSIRASVRVSELAATIEVSDRGPGIAREHQARIFDRFYRVDPSRTRSGGGTGLGLAIAKWAVERSGGEIGLRSSPGAGSTFFICLPREKTGDHR